MSLVDSGPTASSSSSGHLLTSPAQSINIHVSTIAGTGSFGFRDGAANEALFNGLIDSWLEAHMGIAVSASGAVYVADTGNHRIRKIHYGFVTTIAGTGEPGYEDGPALDARFNSPSGIALAPDGMLFVADLHNNCIRTIKDGVVSTIFVTRSVKKPQYVAAGPHGELYFTSADLDGQVYTVRNGSLYSAAGSFRGLSDGPSAQAHLNRPLGLATGPSGALYIVDWLNHAIRKLQNGIVSTVCTFYGRALRAIAVGPDETIYVCNDQGEHNDIWKIQSGKLVIVAGLSGRHTPRDGGRDEAAFQYPMGIAVGHDGEIYVSDGGCRIRKIEIAHLTSPLGFNMFDFQRGLEIMTDVDIVINDTVIKMHRCFIEKRCPLLLEADLKNKPIEPGAIEAFQTLLYAEEMPLKADLRELLSFTYLIFAAGFQRRLEAALKLLESAASERAPPKRLMHLYEKSVQLQFDQGKHLFAKLLREKRNSRGTLPPNNLTPQQLNELCRMIDGTWPEPLPAGPPANKHSCGLKPTMQKLFESKNDADFEILIGKQVFFRCHSWILYARWPFFRHVIRAQLLETQTKQLRLPDNSEEEVGITPSVLAAILEVIYMGEPTVKTLETWDENTALDFLIVSEMYLLDDEAPVVKRKLSARITISATFRGLVEIANKRIADSLTAVNCLDFYSVASENSIESVKRSAGKAIMKHLDYILNDYDLAAKLMAMPPTEQLPILWLAIQSMRRNRNN